MNDHENTCMRAPMKISDYLFLTICWLTVSPVLLIVNRHERYMNQTTARLMVIFSFFSLAILFSFIPLIMGSDNFHELIAGVIPSAYSHIIDLSTNPVILFMEISGMPVYALCVAFLYVTMFFTGWSYREASVYVCEYFAPLFCVLLATVIIIIMALNLRKSPMKAKLWIWVLIGAEAVMGIYSLQTFISRRTLYSDMSIDGIFDYVVAYLMRLGSETHTNYVVANMIVYILPLTMILLLGLVGRIIYMENEDKYCIS